MGFMNDPLSPGYEGNYWDVCPPDARRARERAKYIIDLHLPALMSEAEKCLNAKPEERFRLGNVSGIIATIQDQLAVFVRTDAEFERARDEWSARTGCPKD